MERYENIVKSSEIRKLVDRKKYQKALTILETIEVSKVKVLPDLSVYAEVYIQTGKYDEAGQVLRKLHARTKSRRVIKQLIKLAIKTKNEKEAERYYEEYLIAAPKDMDRYILRYRIDRMKQADLSVLIASLEALQKHEYMEKWCYELAKLYHKAGRASECKKECEDIILWFGKGVMVEKAKRLLAMYETETAKRQMDNIPKSEKTLENTQKFEYNHKSLQDIPNEGNLPVDYEYIYNNEQLKAIFLSYFETEELKRTIAFYFDQAIKTKTAPSFAVCGGTSIGRTTLSKAMAKAIYELHIYESSRIAKIHASKLNEIDLEKNYDRLRDSFLVIEQASMLSKSLRAQIVKMVKELKGHMVVILQEDKKRLGEAMGEEIEFSSLFPVVFEVTKYSKDELMELALNMLQDADFELNPEAKVCLETACNQIAATVIEGERPEELKGLLGRVLKSAEERSMRELTRTNGRIDYTDSDINKIIASDF